MSGVDGGQRYHAGASGGRTLRDATGGAVAWQRAEGALVAFAGLALAVAVMPGWPVWLWPVAFFAPDLGFLGYLAGPVVGARVYNLLHLYGCGLALALAGVATGQPGLIAAGALWMAHAGFDRALGYRLKLPTDFQDTHLGRIGRE
ncbi:DUF4260 family protein [Paracoccus sp. S-4012]|uniref:DUF4260 domain-containing protein n=1 Tax=Paracoccus sp. S-4012 TaxID=2665648 RepID=UPI0012B0A270|nr:DUF4260 domain-containing protein [Paracoccus sp. S-4012]MRX50612.1 DUF4260 family protein [Paracoccus sp. S-4012]